MTKSIFQWPTDRATAPRKATRFIAVHCSATPEGKNFNAADLDRWHRERGWAGIGYHYVVLRDGSIEEGRPRDAMGAHVAGHNSEAIGVVYIGGVAADGKTAKDTRTPEQKAALRQLLGHLKAVYRKQDPIIQGHRDFPHVAKACPSFDAKQEYASL